MRLTKEMLEERAEMMKTFGEMHEAVYSNYSTGRLAVRFFKHDLIPIKCRIEEMLCYTDRKESSSKNGALILPITLKRSMKRRAKRPKKSYY